jgi:hypothetical protein
VSSTASLLLIPLIFVACAGSFTYVPADYSATRWDVGAVPGGGSVADEHQAMTNLERWL